VGAYIGGVTGGSIGFVIGCLLQGLVVAYMDKKKEEEDRQHARKEKMRHLAQVNPQQSLNEILNTRINKTNISNKNNLE
jgi:hypothetical protein